MIENFSLPFSAVAWEDLRSRLKGTRWPETIKGPNEKNGLDSGFLRDLCSYWIDGFDWHGQIDRLSTLPHYRFKTAEGNLHFVHIKGKGPAPLPLVLTHGWPGSFLEMLEVIPLLTNPDARPDEFSFDLIIPSLPGFGFSDLPARGSIDVFQVAELWVELMGALGYERFGAHGGDIGAAVTTALGLRHSEHVVGLHFNYIPSSYKPSLALTSEITPDERRYLADAVDWYNENGGYAHLQGTRPQTLAYALNDSPAGLAAWIVEKFQEWSDNRGDLYSSFTRDVLLTNVTLYWMTETISSSFRMYQSGRRKPLHFSSTDYVQAPCAIACFPKEIMMPPRSWVERGYNVIRWTTMEKGGHFAASEQPELLASDLKTFFRNLHL